MAWTLISSNEIERWKAEVSDLIDVASQQSNDTKGSRFSPESARRAQRLSISSRRAEIRNDVEQRMDLDPKKTWASSRVFAAEGSQNCIGGQPAILVRACERELVTEVGENWGTKVGLDGVACSKEFFLNNPQGREWATTATGERARTIMKAYRDRGLLTAERRLKWNKLRCLAPNDTL